MRGIYAAGIYDYCLDENICFDLGIGVSAGSANLCSFLAKQRERNYRFYTDYAFRRQYMSAWNFLSRGSYIDLDYVYSRLSDQGGEDPVDYPALRDNPMDFFVVATDALTGEPAYFDKKHHIWQDHYDVMKASSAIPAVCKPYVIDERPYFDGALSDPIPVEKAFSLGCDRVVVIVTRPIDPPRDSARDRKMAKLIRRKYPMASEKLASRAELYNRSLARAQEYEKTGKVLLIAPDDTCGVTTLSRDKAALQRLYEKGYGDGEKIKEFLKD